MRAIFALSICFFWAISWAQSSEQAHCEQSFPLYDEASNWCYAVQVNTVDELQTYAQRGAKEIFAVDLVNHVVGEPIFVSGATGSRYNFYLIPFWQKGVLMAIVRVTLPRKAQKNMFPVLLSVDSVKSFDGGKNQRASYQVFFDGTGSSKSSEIVSRLCAKECVSKFREIQHSPNILFGNSPFTPLYSFEVVGKQKAIVWVNIVTKRLITEGEVETVVAKSQTGLLLAATYGQKWFTLSEREQDRKIANILKSLGKEVIGALFTAYEETNRDFGPPTVGRAFSTKGEEVFRGRVGTILSPPQLSQLYP